MNSLRHWILLAGLLLPTLSSALDLSAYQRADGAITVHRYGDHVDPYFAMKALWAARRLGDPAQKETLAWIHWLLPRQKDNGSFSRYCETDGRWQACADADADDSTLALWIELLHEAAPRGLPPLWADSARRAEQGLAQLRDKTTNVYHVSDSIGDALLMDNSEIYAALRRVGELRQGARDAAEAKRYFAQARTLRLAMGKVFRSSPSGLLAWTSGDAAGELFYPHRLAHLYPSLHGMPTDAFDPMLGLQAWLDRYSDAWLDRTDDNFPWGLVALLAYQNNLYWAVDRWMDNAIVLRYSGHWNVLEEAQLQGLARQQLGGQWR
nr:hypothetical protein [Rhodoferax sp.]